MITENHPQTLHVEPEHRWRIKEFHYDGERITLVAFENNHREHTYTTEGTITPHVVSRPLTVSTAAAGGAIFELAGIVFEATFALRGRIADDPKPVPDCGECEQLDEHTLGRVIEVLAREHGLAYAGETDLAEGLAFAVQVVGDLLRDARQPHTCDCPHIDDCPDGCRRRSS